MGRTKTLSLKGNNMFKGMRLLHRSYLGLLLFLGFGQAVVSIMVLLLSPDAPIGSR
ncbi:MAG: hypothetical protein M0Z55_05405 [Peptococcaceae bacterium]|nr:hypothetical protein [Peptococcaceae bacterium]